MTKITKKEAKQLHLAGMKYYLGNDDIKQVVNTFTLFSDAIYYAKKKSGLDKVKFYTA